MNPQFAGYQIRFYCTVLEIKVLICEPLHLTWPQTVKLGFTNARLNVVVNLLKESGKTFTHKVHQK